LARLALWCVEHRRRVLVSWIVLLVGALAAAGAAGTRQANIKLFGLSLAVGVFLDAFVVRCLLLPAVLQLLSRRTWAFPSGLGRRLPRLAPEPDHAEPARCR
jgi:RND superfamily putative drug exporter